MRAKLTARRWIYGGGLSPEWRAVARLRSAEALSRLSALRAKARGRNGDGAEAIGYLLSKDDPRRERLLVHPAFDYWLWAASGREPERLFDCVQGFAAWLACLRGESLKLGARLDAQARLNLYGGPVFLSFPRRRAGQSLRLSAQDGGLRLSLSGAEVVVAKKLLLRAAGGGAAAVGEARLGRNPELAGGLMVERSSRLVLDLVRQVDPLAGRGLPRFLGPLEEALRDIREIDPPLCEELLDAVRMIVPLRNPDGHDSVSSSFGNLRGAICLSASRDPLLQAETLIHEFCHQKLYRLLAADPVLRPGQGGKVFYSPWRRDPRRLWGALLGAHAFLNVARYLLGLLERDRLRGERREKATGAVALRLFQIEDALRTLQFYGVFTEFGAELLDGMWRELGLLWHAAQWFDPEIVEVQRQRCAEHRAKHALGATGCHGGGGDG
ncbi:MAG: hypothetical protein KGO96_03695 [Elusimicrobia bacterium]|nr:hypothetical protein [Elusimicrobiota bacterium]MDE2424996.1 hypothetical protein [Elusimicrobiota bacterium]